MSRPKLINPRKKISATISPKTEKRILAEKLQDEGIGQVIDRWAEMARKEGNMNQKEFSCYACGAGKITYRSLLDKMAFPDVHGVCQECYDQLPEHSEDVTVEFAKDDFEKI